MAIISWRVSTKIHVEVAREVLGELMGFEPPATMWTLHFLSESTTNRSENPE